MAENLTVSCDVVSSIKFSSTIDETKFHSAQTTTTSDETPCWELEEYYNMVKCVECIRNNHFAKVALQFPDSMLCDASKVAQALESQANCKTFILADTSYGSCCVDEIAAEHVKADLIVHFGPACLSLTKRIPVLFVFGKEPINIRDCCQSFKSCVPDLDCRIVIIYEVVYDHAIDEIYSKLATEYKNIIRSSVDCPDDFLVRKNDACGIPQNIVELQKDNKQHGGCVGRDTSGCAGANKDGSGCVAANKDSSGCVGQDTSGCAGENKDSSGCAGGNKDSGGCAGGNNDTSGCAGTNKDGSGCVRLAKDDSGSTQCGCPKCFLVNRKSMQLSISTTPGKDGKYCRFGRTFDVPEGFTIEDYIIFYVGKESLTLTNHMMTYNKCQFYSYNPESNVCRKETLNVNRMLMKRYYLIEKAKDSRVIGILIGTLGVANYLSAITRIKKIIRQAGKKYYTFVVGKLNAEKLANFMEIDVFVLIACPESSLINSKDFYKPIVTPFEIEIACTSARKWTGEYITDFQELLPGAAHHVEVDDMSGSGEHIPDISLISGQLRPTNSTSAQQDKEDIESSSLVKRNQHTALSTQLHTDAAEFLLKRSWKGLVPAKGETDVSSVIEGTKGIATEYTHEPKVDSDDQGCPDI